MRVPMSCPPQCLWGGTGEGSWLLGCFIETPREGEDMERKPAVSQATPGLTPLWRVSQELRLSRE